MPVSTAAVQACKDQLGAAAIAARAETTGPKKPTGSLAEIVNLGPTAKLPSLAKRAKAHAKLVKTKALPTRLKSPPKKPRPK